MDIIHIKKGRPSHAYHSYMMADLKLVLEVEVTPGNQTHSKYSLPGLMHKPELLLVKVADGAKGLILPMNSRKGIKS